MNFVKARMGNSEIGVNNERDRAARTLLDLGG
jgi:hypothetical protein